MYRNIYFGHSPDADDAFMLYGLATGKVNSGEFKIQQVVKDIETLNGLAMEGKLDITAVSLGAMPFISREYAILPYGASMGDGYGPVVISNREMSLDDLRGKKVAVPGKYTTANLVFSIYVKEFTPVLKPFDKIMEAVRTGEADAGVLIHEGQLTYKDERFYAVADLGKRWKEETHMLLPLGLDVIKKDLDEDIKPLMKLFRDSIVYSMEHRDEAMAYAENFGRGVKGSTLNRFVNMYVNEYTMDLGELGRKSIKALLSRAHEEKLIRSTDVDIL